jgi:hypothetical protein
VILDIATSLEQAVVDETQKSLVQILKAFTMQALNERYWNRGSVPQVFQVAGHAMHLPFGNFNKSFIQIAIFTYSNNMKP